MKKKLAAAAVTAALAISGVGIYTSAPAQPESAIVVCGKFGCPKPTVNKFASSSGNETINCRGIWKPRRLC